MIKKAVIFIIIIIVITITYHKKKYPEIFLKGDTIINLVEGEKYEEPGYEAKNSNGKDITKDVSVEGNVGMTRGVYELVYSVLDNNEKVVTRRFIKVSKLGEVYKDSYDKIDNTSRGWWSGNKFDNQRPSGGADINDLKKYNAFFLGKDEKVLYLTFDEGSLETYVKEIVDVLDKNNVKATFFLCMKYIEENPELIKKMVISGHSIGNHTHRHLNMPSLANREKFSSFLSEIKETEDAFYKVTGKEMDKIYREPRGEWSFRDLQIMKDLGYKTYFYSANHNDFSGTLSKEQALNELTKRYHNGAIYLIHPNNKGNYEALEPFILEMKKQGFSFDLVKNI